MIDRFTITSRISVSSNISIIFSSEQHQVIDDEYAFMGVKDPKIVLTSARDPSARLMQFLKEFRVLFPNCQRVNRGTQTMKDFVEMCRKNDVSDIITVHEHRGKPDGLIISHLPYGPTAYFSLKNVNMRHDLETKPAPMSEANPHLIFHDFDTPLGKRVQTILQALFPPAAPQGQRVMTFANARDTIHYRHYNFGYDSKKKNVKPEEVDLKECGPRFSMMLYKIELGTLDMTDAKVEWVLRPYFNKQKDALKDNSAQQALGTS